MSCQWRIIQKLKGNWLAVLKLTWGTWQIFIWALESLKNVCFNWLLVTKVYIVWATKAQGSYLSWHWRVNYIRICKFWRKTDLWFEKQLEKFGKFSPEHLIVSKLGLWWDPLVQSRKCITLKFSEELCVMTIMQNLKRNWLVISKLTWGI